MADSFATLAQAFENRAQKYRARTFLKDKSDKIWHDHSWAGIADAAARLRAGLQKIGIQPGDRVGILSDNSPQWVIVDQAVLGLGGIVVPLYTTSGAEETRHVISDSGAKVVASNGAEYVNKLCALAPSLPELKTILAMHGGAPPEAAHEWSCQVLLDLSLRKVRAPYFCARFSNACATVAKFSAIHAPSERNF